jgi:WD40 repeat protein
MNDTWSACLQTLEGHNDIVKSVAFSHDSIRLASASYDSTVKIWDASSGACLQTLKDHNNTCSEPVRYQLVRYQLVRYQPRLANSVHS